ncbi:septal ring lytic transglycosylase RlpA family protein [Paucibacter sp. APW11]|uniref:Endolytic peptidoglycan transglycosylase RlpA n=1 Tax=Roseateles aquae TaxID=3077235 RepID=A0ABU3PIS5_9BURK|nr:septal ring lytic transglycosylase RlpA family protein [Paucibacter sp. APW11]MDT9001921.1 septal ring lytic transglycosylase RlpA family protein [Paucibacter sp. APW11]
MTRLPAPAPLSSSLPSATHGRLAASGLLLGALLLGGCASHQQLPVRSSSTTPPPALPSSPDRDGAEAVVPPNLNQVPDAQPRLEAIRKGGPNKPYEALGQRYEPMTEDAPLVERGLASWYGKKFHGRPTSSGEVYNMYAMTGAHATMPIPSYARVRNPANGREVIVRINDRGPFHPGRIIDLSYTAALKLDVLRGVSPVEVERITYEAIRTGAWQRGAVAPVYAAAEAAGAPSTVSTAMLATESAPPSTASAVANTPSTASSNGLPQDLTPLTVSASIAAKPSAAPPTVSAIAPNPQAAMPLARASAPGFWIQLGAFSRLDGAEQFRQKLLKELDWMGPLLAIFKESSLHRLQAGPYASREDARQAAERVRLALALTPLVVERR